jgi:hypothetical protein
MITKEVLDSMVCTEVTNCLLPPRYVSAVKEVRIFKTDAGILGESGRFQ